MGSFPYVIRVFVVRRLTARREYFFSFSHLRQKKGHINTKLHIRQFPHQNGLFFRMLSETVNRQFTRASAKFSGESICVCPTQTPTPHFLCTVMCRAWLCLLDPVGVILTHDNGANTGALIYPSIGQIFWQKHLCLSYSNTHTSLLAPIYPSIGQIFSPPDDTM